ncbi:MAG TPA: pyridoxamine 5'-phosphate oxidase family protein [Capsulimonadaceae bacterium]|jgi:general stress protein 26
MAETLANDIRKLYELIKDHKVAMLTTRGSDGTLHSRPMATQEAEFDGTLWFLTGKDTHKVDDINADYEVNVSYSGKSSSYVSVSGTATFTQDSTKIDELWSELYKAWFPKGKEDPNILVLKVEVNSAEYWESPSSPVATLVGFIQAIATGHQANVGENKTLTIT